jgi:hypothetical protein
LDAEVGLISFLVFSKKNIFKNFLFLLIKYPVKVVRFVVIQGITMHRFAFPIGFQAQPASFE